MRWHGGKWLLAQWLAGFFPPHGLYVEPYGGGAASVLLRKPRSPEEIYNDADAEVVNLFRVLRGEGAERLIEQIRLTPFSREEYMAAHRPIKDPVERARRLVVRSFLGRGVNSQARRRLFRWSGAGQACSPAADWAALPAHMPAMVERLRGVVIESRDPLALIGECDAPTTLFYVDPPYQDRLRAGARGDPLDRRLETLLSVLSGLGGMVVLSGCATRLYDDALPGWRRRDGPSAGDGGRSRTESAWLNPACAEALGEDDLFTRLSA